ncbi:MAG TPA: PEP/pyruvate-binding domain-containing protein [Anaerolineales bacterium]|nr:PEP/pyruvate-binding domain-containing protein [Anaerolineales bacterium]
MTLPPPSADRTLSIYLALAQYPILSTKIRNRMRRELFKRGVISQQAFEAEARDKAIRSQAMEGIHNPFADEPAEVWEMRLLRVREHLTDFYFAYNLPYDLFEQIIREVLSERGAEDQEMLVSFNPELAPQSMLFEQAFAIEKMPPKERALAEARLREIKVVLIRTMISDQLAYVNIAKEWFTISDLSEIRKRRIGAGKIGGKSAGMLLAARILIEAGDDEIRRTLRIPESYFIGADMTYGFMGQNNLLHWADQKYKGEEQIRSEYPQLQKEFLLGEFPADFLESLRDLLEQVGHKPLIVRSSSLLEDNFGTSFAGKYESHFCPNQGSPEENLLSLTQAIKRIYASILNPDALLYRRAKGLQDYDERMAILIQVVDGERLGRYHLPHASGVAFSRNLYRWTPQIRREDGFLRLVWGLGTRAVDRVGNDYPRLVALSHPLLHPQASAKDIRRYSQMYVDLLDMQANTFKTLPISEVLEPRYPVLRYLAQVDQGGYLAPLRSTLMEANIDQLVLTFDELLRRSPLADRMKNMLKVLEKHYHSPVDTEFTVKVVDPEMPQPEIEISLLQCRPQSRLQESEVRLPENIPAENIIFSTPRMAPRGHIPNIRHVLFVTPEGYFSLPGSTARARLVQAISALNAALANKVFICVGPGRWGTSNPDLGIRIGYGDIYNTRALIELAGKGIGAAPEASFGTHFFQDLVESNIYPLAIYLDDEGVIFRREFFYDTPNIVSQFLPEPSDGIECLRLVEVSSYRPNHHLELVMDDEEGRTVAYLVPD